jgi:pSer/pThr/pTyr-binding forkhead associated (FHA) protein
MIDANKTQMLSGDPNRTQMGTAPTVDPNRTILGGAPSLNVTATIKPIQCPVCKTFNPIAMMFCVECGLIFERALDGDAFGAPAIQLPVLRDENGREYTLRPGENVIGRAGDIAIEDGRISRKHGIVRLNGTSVTFEDVGSTNGTKVAGARLVVGQPMAIDNGVEVSLGGYKLTLSMPGEESKTAMAMGGKTAAISAPPTTDASVGTWSAEGYDFKLTHGKHVFGRKADSAFCIPDPYVSGRHGEIEVSDEGVFLVDVGSTNGTLLNGAKLPADQRVQLNPTDEVQLGSLVFRLILKS